MWRIGVHCPQILLSLRKHGKEESRLLNLRRLRCSRQEGRFHLFRRPLQLSFGDRKGTTKKLCDKDFAERSGELSGAIRLKTLVLLGNDR